MSPDDRNEAASQIRPYTLTSGRTKATVELPVEATLALAPDRPREDDLDASHARVVALCAGSPSVAEISSRVGAPLGVVRVLISDLVESGHLTVQATLGGDASSSEREDLIERTLRGLRAI